MRRQYWVVSGISVLAMTAAGCGDNTNATQHAADAPPPVPTVASDPTPPVARGGEPKVPIPPVPPPKQLETWDIREGTGPAAKRGSWVVIDYVGKVYSTGKEFYTSYRPKGSTYSVTLGRGEVIEGWDKGIVGMRAGGRRHLIVPPDMGYGARGFPPKVGPNETLVFVIELVDIRAL